MESIGQAIYTALRDDSEATNGIRALLGNTGTTPYNVYHSHLPDNIDFNQSSGAHSFITYFLVSSVSDNSVHGADGRLVEEVYNITVYSRTLSTLESVHRRIKLRLHDMRNITAPSSQARIHQVRFENEIATQWDDDFKVFFRPAFYRVWGRDDNI